MLKRTHLYMMAAAIMALLFAWLINMDLIFSADVAPPTTQLQLDINECDGIAQKSVAHLKVVVPYQLLEKKGRQARVMRLCMADHQYQENPAWRTYATPLAQQRAQKEHLSFDETLENLRRKHMVMFNTDPHTPSYWIGLNTN